MKYKSQVKDTIEEFMDFIRENSRKGSKSLKWEYDKFDTLRIRLVDSNISFQTVPPDSEYDIESQVFWCGEIEGIDLYNASKQFSDIESTLEWLRKMPNLSEFKFLFR